MPEDFNNIRARVRKIFDEKRDVLDDTALRRRIRDEIKSSDLGNNEKISLMAEASNWVKGKDVDKNAPSSELSGARVERPQLPGIPQLPGRVERSQLPAPERRSQLPGLVEDKPEKPQLSKRSLDPIIKEGVAMLESWTRSRYGSTLRRYAKDARKIEKELKKKEKKEELRKDIETVTKAAGNIAGAAAVA
ncbi:MAG: hypothetical protein J7J92_00450 [Candidatus Aenigmarchaeota archaeon]|nr:hypothetical protein [Candidatus Aenigmarchaeota archaeon]